MLHLRLFRDMTITYEGYKEIACVQTPFLPSPIFSEGKGGLYTGQ